MKKDAPLVISSLSEFSRIMELPKPGHPLISVIRFESIGHIPEAVPSSVVLNFFSIWLKKDFNGKMKYGHQPYDFDEGLMSFFSPGQVLTSEVGAGLQHNGWWLIIHPDFLWGYPLAAKIKDYGFFSYAVNEALHLSEKEEKMIAGILENIEQEYQLPIDAYSHPAIISQLETLLVYAERYYHRQFITRKKASHAVLTRLETLLSTYIDTGRIPTVKEVSRDLLISPNYLSDQLRALTGKSTQQHIQDRLVEKGKELLSTTRLSISEIAYNLGFEYPQSFSKLFKSKTSLSPQAFREGFN